MQDDQNNYESVKVESQKKVKNELETLKEHMKKELLEKADLLEQEYRNIEDLKITIREDYEKKVKGLEERYSVKLETQDKEYRHKL